MAQQQPILEIAFSRLTMMVVLSHPVSSLFVGGDKGILDKTDVEGNTIWMKELGHESGDIFLNSVYQNTNGGFITSGVEYFPGSTGLDLFVRKFDPEGHLEWYSTLVGVGNEWASAIQQTSGGGYIVGGGFSDCIYSNNLLILKINEYGVEQWSRQFNASPSSYEATFQVEDGGYVTAGGKTYLGFAGIFMARMDAHGTVEWTKTIPEEGYDYNLNAACETKDNGYAFGGIRSQTDPIQHDFLLIKTNKRGNIR